MSTKNILLAVSGGIAVFKAAALTSKMVQAGFSVKVMMTGGAQEFVTPRTFQALSREHVYTDTFDEPDPHGIAHIDIADWADVVLIAPATADVIGKLANGIADDMVTTTLLAATCPVLAAPAMNVHMYSHPAVQRNMKQLTEDGYQFIEPDEGYLACGYTGKGRMAEPEDLLAMVQHHFIYRSHPAWHGKKVLVTAGPTQEEIDPVRFLSNRSSGKMGFALAEEAAARGADVTLVSGPSSLPDPHGVRRVNVESAADMYDAVTSRFDEQDLVIKAAAVSDYTPTTPTKQKEKKQDEGTTINMKRTKDILLELGNRKKGQVLVGFAAETEDLEEYAKAKLEKKNLDLICANDVSGRSSGFQSDNNTLSLFFKDGSSQELELMSKKEAAAAVLDAAGRKWSGPHDR
ncbi:bifunctional phosphopantothenoylcysteine decarboxylase/phosphopantothenate--cysteine ligase CoaBC [Alkalicoccus chagannorensis]|uniref:bifunctional phosphopantothenoylcysteine decarboxylase/phosphopantothenate--cysteine ligase CoaBC n=1 Tax=Alkalicoccus chagannorensis TaxID=427072 RepID=UPI000425496B|nr:bifunctional phosphopantothenoylcysteine decarboxylase/phosphopantothenate--cysteine ligase CoaBC [Alkalicoccus chagannorensis]